MGSPGDPKIEPKSSHEGQKWLQEGVPGPFPKRVPKKVDFLVVLGVPGTSKIELPPRRELNFHLFSFPPFGNQNGSKNGAKMEPKWLPNSLGGRLGGFPEPSQKSVKKCIENARFLGALGEPWGGFLEAFLKGISRPFAEPLSGSLLGAIWEPFGTIFKPFLDNFGTILGTILGQCWGRFWTSRGESSKQMLGESWGDPGQMTGAQWIQGPRARTGG